MYDILSDFIYCLNYNILSFSVEIAIPHKYFIFTYFFMRLQLILCSKKNEDNLNNKNHHDVLMLFLLTMLIAFLLQDNAILLFLCLESLKEFIVFHNSN